MQSQYLGDGLYVEDQGFQIRLFTDRTDGTHEVFLENGVLLSLFKFLERRDNIKITITKEPESETNKANA